MAEKRDFEWHVKNTHEIAFSLQNRSSRLKFLSRHALLPGVFEGHFPYLPCLPSKTSPFSGIWIDFECICIDFECICIDFECICIDFERICMYLYVFVSSSICIDFECICIDFECICRNPIPFPLSRQPSAVSLFWRFLRWSRSVCWPQGQLRKQLLTLFTVILLIGFISGPAWDADFEAIYGDRAHCAHLRASWGSIFWRFLRWSRSLCWPQAQSRKHILTLFTVIQLFTCEIEFLESNNWLTDRVCTQYVLWNCNLMHVSI